MEYYINVFWLIYVQLILCTWKLLFMYVMCTFFTIREICQDFRKDFLKSFLKFFLLSKFLSDIFFTYSNLKLWITSCNLLWLHNIKINMSQEDTWCLIVFIYDSEHWRSVFPELNPCLNLSFSRSSLRIPNVHASFFSGLYRKKY